MRITVQFTLSSATDVVQIDVGVGDAVVPMPDRVAMPSMLGFSPVYIRAYPKETVIAEKLEAMVTLGIRNSRMKDFFDVWMLSRSFTFEGSRLSEAIAATFQRRRTAIPTLPPLALSAEFWQDPTKQVQWRAFLRRMRIDETPHSLEHIITDLQAFLIPVLRALESRQKYSRNWSAVSGWQDSDVAVPATDDDMQSSVV